MRSKPKTVLINVYDGRDKTLLRVTSLLSEGSFRSGPNLGPSRLMVDVFQPFELRGLELKRGDILLVLSWMR